MGRRKIEIQPITHERNRSVTFQKRKNGLFKKAYELGVLCSVDVAVILFEQRPGHPPKLYQYGSSNIHEIVQRQLRHDGENDTRGPAEFTGGGAGGKNDDDDDVDEGEGDGEVDDDGEDLGPPLTKVSTRSKRRGDGQFKPMATGVLQQDMDYRISSVPSHMPLGPPQPHLPSPSHSTFGLSGSIHHHHQRQQHPISSDRLRPMDQYQDGQHQSKRPRLDVLTAPQQHHQQYNRGGSQSSLPSPVNQGRGGEYGYHPSPSQFPGPPSSHQYPPQYAFPAGGSLSSHPHPYPVSSPGPPPPFLSLNAQTPAEYSYPPPPPPGSGLPSSSPGSRPSSRRDSGSAYANTRSAGGVYGNENGNRTQIANGMYAPSPGPGSGQGGSAISNEHDGTKLLSDIFGSTSAARGSGDAANSANPASVREEDGSVGSNPNAPGVWLDFLSTPTGVGATSSTTQNDNGNVSLRNAASKLSSSSTSASQVPSPATEASASGNAVEGVSLSGLGLFEMGTGGDEDTGSRGSDKSKDRQESGGV